MIKRILAALAASLCIGVQAQDAIDIDDLKLRSEAGDKAATRALAEAYYVGRGGVEQNYQTAALWYRRLATQGDARAQTSLGLMYARGLGFEKNLSEARRWWSLAAAQNDPGAQHNLGVVYLEGQGVPADAAQALHWFRRAAARGHVLSQRILGLMLYDGVGTAPDRIGGLMWITIAAENGEEVAEQTLKMLAERVPAAQMSEARTRGSRSRSAPSGRTCCSSRPARPLRAAFALASAPARR